MSLPASLLLKYNWPITLCQFLACNLVIPYFCRLQNDHHDTSSYHLLPYYWLHSHTVHFITVKVFLKLSMYFFFYTHNGVAHLQYRVSRTFICTGKPLPPPKNKQTNCGTRFIVAFTLQQLDLMWIQVALPPGMLAAITLLWGGLEMEGLELKLGVRWGFLWARRPSPSYERWSDPKVLGQKSWGFGSSWLCSYLFGCMGT